MSIGIHDGIAKMAPLLRQWRRDFHANPELAFEEARTSQLVQQRLSSFSIKIYTSYAGTGVVGVLQNGTSKRSIGLRADMDALPIAEQNDFEYCSQNNGKMHACGHDGHITILLGAAKYLAETQNFDGTVYFIFQPAEEFGGGANVMISDGLLNKFQIDEIYGLHNWPGLAAGHVGYKTGVLTASADRFAISLKGKGGHAALPHTAADTVVTAAHLVIALQTVVSRNINPFSPAVLSSCALQTGTVFNVLPERAEIQGTVRTMNEEAQNTVKSRMTQICNGMALTFNTDIELDYQTGYPPTVNAAAQTDYVRRAAIDVLGENCVTETEPTMGGEDFAFFLQKLPGSYFFLGNGNSTALHTPNYDFNDEIIPTGIAVFTRLVENRLAVGTN